MLPPSARPYTPICLGEEDDFADLVTATPSIRLCLNFDVRTTFHALVEADAFLPAR